VATLTYERGDAQHPAGHAFLYFGNGEDVTATYLVVGPIPFDVGKYIPPLLASSLGSMGLPSQTSFFPIPPVPETLKLSELRSMAEWRGDDILVDPFTSASDPAVLMTHVAEIGEAYANAYKDAWERAAVVEDAPRTTGESTEGLALLYSVLPERERIAEIARRLGTLRYAVEVRDAALVESTCAEMRAIGAYLSANYRIKELIDAAQRPDAEGARLAQLYVERGYKLSAADEEGVPALDAEIESLEHHHA
jgi:hypothetical protein